MTEQTAEERAAALAAFIDAWLRAADEMAASLEKVGRAAAGLVCAAFGDHGRVVEQDPWDRALQARQCRGSGPPRRRLDGRPSR